MSTARAVAITGIGVVTPIGLGRDAFWSAASAGVAGISRIRDFDASKYACQVAGQIENPRASPYYQAVWEQYDRVTILALLAAAEALAQAGIDTATDEQPRCGVYVGTGIGGVSTHERECRRFHDGHRVHPMSILRVMYNASAARIAAQWRLAGPSLTVSTACASGAQAIGEAAATIARGDADAILAGGTEAPLSEPLFAAWNSMRVMSRWDGDPGGACRPFSADRSGLVLGEGAAFLILEAEDRAKARGVRILGRVRAYASNTTVSHPTAPDVASEAAVLRRALTQAGLGADDTAYIAAHGTGTPGNDVAETRAIREVFGAAAGELRVSSAKSQCGHSLGAAGAIGAVTALLALQNRMAPPTINLDRPDPECDLNYVAHKSQPLPTAGAALVNAFGFGGTNIVLVIDTQD